MVKIAFTIPPAWVPEQGRIRMVHGRIEMSSAEQLVELRKARDRYKALADSFREEGDALANRFESEGDPLIVMQEKLKYERDARRIANAYEKSIANIVASSTLMQQAQTSRRGARNIGPRLAVLIFSLIVAGVIASAVAYPGFYRQVLAYLPDRSSIEDYFVPTRPVADTGAGTLPAAAPEPPATAQQNPIAPKPSPAVVPRRKRAVRATGERSGKPAPSNQEDGDFVVKVLQPDGTLKEQTFSARPRR